MACVALFTCAPLLVAGEVIGSVLVNHDHPLSDVAAAGAGLLSESPELTDS